MKEIVIEYSAEELGTETQLLQCDPDEAGISLAMLLEHRARILGIHIQGAELPQEHRDRLLRRSALVLILMRLGNATGEECLETTMERFKIFPSEGDAGVVGPI